MIDNRGVWGYLEEALKGMGFVVLLLVGLVLAFVLARQAGLPREMLPFIVVPPLYLLVCRLGRRNHPLFHERSRKIGLGVRKAEQSRA
nr:hypothetical protein [uncultured Desulfobulbus sp.]